jgi:hypothetical protein
MPDRIGTRDVRTVMLAGQIEELLDESDLTHYIIPARSPIESPLSDHVHCLNSSGGFVPPPETP